MRSLLLLSRDRAHSRRVSHACRSTASAVVSRTRRARELFRRKEVLGALARLEGGAVSKKKKHIATRGGGGAISLSSLESRVSSLASRQKENSLEKTPTPGEKVGHEPDDEPAGDGRPHEGQHAVHAAQHGHDGHHLLLLPGIRARQGPLQRLNSQVYD